MVRVPAKYREPFVVAFALLAALVVSTLLSLPLFETGLLVVLGLIGAAVALVPGVWPALYRKTGIAPRAWLLALLVAVVGVGITHVVGTPQPFCDRYGYRGCLTTYGYASAVFLGSSLGVAIVAGHLGRYRRIRGATLGPASEAGDGLVAVEGRLVPVGSTVDGPVSGEPTVWSRSVVEEPTLFGMHIERDRATDGDAFYVEDGSGRLLVLPDHFDDHDVASLARTSTDEAADGRRREWSYQPDDAVTVVGRAREVSRAEYPESVVLGRDDPVLVGLGRQGDLRSWAAQRVVGGGALTLVVGGLSFAVMVATA